MKQKIFLTSVIAMGFVAPAMAEPSNTDTFPQSGLMQEDYTYTNAATSTNMAGVYEGEVNAVAQYTDNLYQLVAGQYLPANSETPIDCDQNGYFCPGDNNGVYYSSSAQGLTQCPSGYGNSGTGASSDTECYRQCSGNVTIEHATAVTGNDYYGSGTDTCEPTACVHGWHVKPAIPDLTTTIGVSEAASGYGYRSHDGEGENLNESLYNITNYGEFVVDFGDKGKIHGYASCSSRGVVTNPWNEIKVGVGYTYRYELKSDSMTNTLPDSTGEKCYCMLDGYTPYNGNLQSFSSSWLYVGKWREGESIGCIHGCSRMCASNLWSGDAENLSYRAALFGIVEPTMASCEANTITINWGDTDDADVTANEAGTATYGSDIRTPVKAQTKPGKTFTGWRFSAPQQASVQEP